MPVPHSSPWLRFQPPLVEPDMQISRIRLSDEIMPSPTESSPYAARRQQPIHAPDRVSRVSARPVRILLRLQVAFEDRRKGY